MKAIVAAAESAVGVRIADWSGDVDHNRMVLTIVGEPEPVLQAVLAAAKVAINKIDLRVHAGVHPRLGALDVLPFVPVKNITMQMCVDLAIRAGSELVSEFQLPVFYYEAAAFGRSLPSIRKQAFIDIFPDVGPTDAPHPTAGASVIGARRPLIAYNVDLDSKDMKAARTIARELREGGSSGIPGVRTLALFLESRQCAQISVNIIDTDRVTPFHVFSAVEERAKQLGIAVAGSEVIGAIPGYSAFGIIAESLKAQGLKPGQILFENWPE